MADSDVRQKITIKDLVKETRYRVFSVTSGFHVFIFCDMRRFAGSEAKKESVMVSVDKAQYLNDRQSTLADAVTRGTKELYREIRSKYPELVQ